MIFLYKNSEKFRKWRDRILTSLREMEETVGRSDCRIDRIQLKIKQGNTDGEQQ